MMMQMKGESPAACAMRAPAMLKKARPSASAYCKALSGGGKRRTHSQVAAAAIMEMAMNEGSAIQKTG